MDGAHCGLGDWYKEIEQGIQNALDQGSEHEWTTGWYASKKEIASAQITNADGGMRIEVSVSDDFDTPGLGCEIIPHTMNLETVREAIYRAWSEAEIDQKDNRMYVGYSIHAAKENGAWIETYIKARGEGTFLCGDSPPGDSYHQWGFQDDGHEIPEDVKEKLEDWVQSNDFGSFTVGEFTVKAWDEAEHLND
jgi:hypothetical protein